MSEARHARLLLAIVRRRADEASRWAKARGSIDGAPFDPPTFVRLCRQCEVHPWVHALLDRGADGLGWELVGDDVRAELDAARQKVRQDNLLLLARLEQALDCLAGVGVVPVALKGTDTLHRFYNGLDERTLDDVDLLVRREQLMTALEALERAGWEPPPEPARTRFIRSSHHLPLVRSGPVTVDFELHWNIAQDRRYSVDVDGMFARARPLSIAGREALRLENHDAVAHQLIHHFSHYLTRGLKGLVDMERRVAETGFSWHEVAERVRRWGGVAASGISLLHIHKLWPELAGREALAALPVPVWRRLVLGPLRSPHPLELYRHTGHRKVQLLLAAVMLERVHTLPAWLLHRMRRTAHAGDNPLDPAGPGMADGGSGAGGARR